MNFLKLFNKPNLIAAHRGARSEKPENTLAALSSSVGRCDFMEIDVQLSKDLIPVIMHDSTLSRTSNVSKLERFDDRRPWRVCDFSLKELQELDFGSWFNDKYEPMLSLEKALLFAKEEDIFLNVEIKDMSNDFTNEHVTQIIMDMIKKTKTQDLVLLSSFYHPYLLMCKDISAEVPTAALQMYVHPSRLIEYLMELKVNAYHPEDNLADKEVIAKLREAGFFVNIFTVNKINRQNELFSWGVNGVFTDFLL